MAETGKQRLGPETQKERWMKYGANVALASVLVVLIAVALIALASRFNRRLDTTQAGLYSLKPQTINLIRDNKSDIKLVSLYTRARRDASYSSSDEVMPVTDFAQPVADLLEEYRRKGRNIEVEIIDPTEQPTKVDQLIDEVTRKYGGEVQKYKSLVEEYLPPIGPDGKVLPLENRKPTLYEQIVTSAAEEAKKFEAALPEKLQVEQDLGDALMLTSVTVQGMPKLLERINEGVARRLKQRPPDYKGAVNSIEGGMSDLSQLAGRIVEDFGKLKDDSKVPESIRKYMQESIPRYEQIKKLAEGVEKRIKELGELKLDALRQSLRQRDAVLVMGPTDLKVIPFDKVWQVPEDARGFTPDGKPRPRFAGEQQITSAILALTTEKKPKVVFVRPGGGPLTTRGFLGFQPSGPLSLIASRLQDYNFEVLEKDLSGMWAMQSQMQGMPSPPEPTDEQIKDAIWVVLNIPQSRGFMGMSPGIASKVADHLKGGGSALILSMPETDNLSAALDEWGIKLRPDAIIVHEPVKASPGQPADMVEEAMRVPYIFTVKDYGDHMLARPLRSLNGVLVPMVVVQTEPKAGYRSTPIVPIPQTLKVWGETNVRAALDDLRVEYDPGSGDLPPPLYAGAAVEKEGGNRLVVIGSVQFILNDLLRIPDPGLARQGILVSRFPGNAELFMNSIFWLAKMDPMIAISPSAMEVSRIREMPAAVQNAWRIGLLLVVLPGSVIALGLWVYVSRQD